MKVAQNFAAASGESAPPNPPHGGGVGCALDGLSASRQADGRRRTG